MPEIQAIFAVFHLAGSKSSHLGKETFSSLLFNFFLLKKKKKKGRFKHSYSKFKMNAAVFSSNNILPSICGTLAYLYCPFILKFATGSSKLFGIHCF